jgi:uncharacterized protein (TIGR03086 family)
MTPPPPPGNQLSRTMSAVDHLVAGIRQEQWLAPTPCTDWKVRDLVNHLVGMNLVFAALMSDQPPPQRGADRLGNDPLGAYRGSGVALAAACDQPGVLERTFHGPLGAATGAERLNIRIADLLVHGWDLAQATDASAPAGGQGVARACPRLVAVRGVRRSLSSAHPSRRHAARAAPARCVGRRTGQAGRILDLVGTVELTARLCLHADRCQRSPARGASRSRRTRLGRRVAAYAHTAGENAPTHRTREEGPR